MAPILRRARHSGGDIGSGSELPGHSHHPESGAILFQLKSTLYRILPVSSLPFYFRHTAFLPSLSLSLLYLTVLSFSGQMMTYLIAVGYTPSAVGFARTASAVFELSATWVAPWLIKHIGVVRGGMWGLGWQMVWLAAGMSWFFTDFKGLDTNSVLSATGLAVGVAFSRVGLWTFDLCAQDIVQDVSAPWLIREDAGVGD